ncbi:hypothetical protein BAUCODRAFT_123826 [Baudoinia panamericana UAMH 10762]|uniref:Uncharacterized protein n=1 Tax=Baudoinia panamericana (strain UAMH 10762) TaxID=717646 RepID=M2MFF7_BAUPA|nr:uncharacterized protein BAUCODRAFT_123826 [Baudoinia panamericana UAMH 10762]EMC95381.1 hypothetical protein BAUCODRAFT_123826 [Baudoinia panamericana UAMH 10762]
MASDPFAVPSFLGPTMAAQLVIQAQYRGKAICRSRTTFGCFRSLLSQTKVI